MLEIKEIKKQIAVAMQAVEDLEEPFKTAAFGIVLSKLLEGFFAKEKIPIGKPLIVGAPEVPPAIVGANTCREAIAKLFASDWGRKPRTMRQIADAMKLSAIYYPDANIATELNRMTRIGLLRRLKDKKGFTYVSAKPAAT